MARWRRARRRRRRRGRRRLRTTTRLGGLVASCGSCPSKGATRGSSTARSWTTRPSPTGRPSGSAPPWTGRRSSPSTSAEGRLGRSRSTSIVAPTLRRHRLPKAWTARPSRRGRSNACGPRSSAGGTMREANVVPSSKGSPSGPRAPRRVPGHGDRRHVPGRRASRHPLRPPLAAVRRSREPVVVGRRRHRADGGHRSRGLRPASDLAVRARRRGTGLVLTAGGSARQPRVQPRGSGLLA